MPDYWRLNYQSISNNEVETGITKEGHPWIGSADAVLTIEEYSDYRCFQCAKMHRIIRQLISEFPGKIKLIHYHYPLDHEYNPIIVRKPFHIGSGKMSLLGIHAFYTGNFWEVSDQLFEIGKRGESFNTKVLEERTGISSGQFAAALNHKKYIKYLNRDIKKGMKLRITETPTFIINGEKHVGTIPTSVLKMLENE